MGKSNDKKNELDFDNLFAEEVEVDASDIDQSLLESLLEEADKNEEAAASEPVVEKTPVVEEPVAQPVVEMAPVVERKDKPAVNSTDVTVITKGTTINGSIISDCSLDVMGAINGDIECLGKLTISGKVTGNSRAAEVFINTDRLDGSIVSEGTVKVGLGTVIVGDVTASSAVFAGAIKGEIDVNGPVVLDSTAIVKGNIKAKSLQMNNGAILDGNCSLVYSDLDVNSVFD